MQGETDHTLKATPSWKQKGTLDRKGDSFVYYELFQQTEDNGG